MPGKEVPGLCLSCGCDQPGNAHGIGVSITLGDLQAAADAAGITLVRAAANILQTLTGTLADNEPEPEGPEEHFLLGVAYQPGRDPRIARGVDGARDCFTPGELEHAAWNFMLDGRQHGLFHMDGTEGAAQTVESGIYRNPIPWIVDDDLIVRKGTWLVGALVDDKGWELHKQGKVNGLSPQGPARRRRIRH
jgi:hypothetical protein